jgi:DNA polymerase elongation subunit (family B)
MQAIAARQLEKSGYDVHPGQTISYIITNAGSSKPYEKVTALPLIKEKTRYDRSAYMQMLVSAAETLFNVFGYTQNRIWEAVHGERQTKLQVELKAFKPLKSIQFNFAIPLHCNRKAEPSRLPAPFKG